MFKPRKNLDYSFPIEQLKEIYRDHPNMRSVDVIKKQLKQEKLQDKIFYQSLKEEATDKQ